MRIFFFSLFCTLLLWGCSNNRTSNVVTGGCLTEDYHKAKFDSFLTQFAQFDGARLDDSFFKVRKQFPGEKWCPEICKFTYSSILPGGESSDNELCLRPCCKMEAKNFYVVAIKRERYSYEDNVLLTYDKKGQMIDVEKVGINNGFIACRIEPSSSEYEFTFRQYTFRDVESGYNGLCDVSEYRVSIDESGNVSKQLLSEEKGVTVAL